MKRLNKTLNDYSSRLEAFGIENEFDKITLLTKLRDCDVSKGKYTRFLLECYLDKTIRDEDLSGGLEGTVGKTIYLFHKNKNKLPEEDRSLNRYKTVGKLWKNVRQFEKEKSAHELKKEHRDKINSQTKFIVDKDYKILSPLTKESAQFWGQGTRWCTSAKENNAFDEYNNKAPLFIVIFPNGDKFQLWRNNYDNETHNHVLFDRFEAMDEADNKIDKNFFEDNWNYFKELYDIFPLYYIPKEKLTYEKCLKEVEKDGWNLQYVPDEFRTYDLCLEAVKNDGQALNYVPDEFRTYDLCLEAVKNRGWSLEDVPDEFKTYELCLEAIKNTGWTLENVPESLKDYNLCLEAVKKDGGGIKYVPEEFKTYELCLEAVKNHGQALNYVPEESKTYDLCLEAVKNDGQALNYVPEESKTYDLCLEAVKNDGHLRDVPDEFRTYDLCLEAVKNTGWALENVPENLLTEEIFDIAINRTAIVFIKEEFMKKKEEFMKENEKQNNEPSF